MKSFSSILTIVFATTCWADNLLPPERPIPQVVDHYIQALQKQNGITPAPQIDDRAFLRRASLDLIGRIPTLPEQKQFLQSKDSNKREQLVDRLMNDPAFVRHQARELNRLLMAETGGNLDTYLAKALTQKRPWDRIFRELMLPNQKDPDQKGAIEFLKRRARDVDRMTNQISVIFFGVNVSCAKCHDHPLVEDWKQDHFYGMKSFLSRTFDNGGFLGERGYGQVKFKTTKGKERTAKLMFLTGKVVKDPMEGKQPSKAEQQKEKKALNDYKKKKIPPPSPKFSAREQLVNLALQPEERQFFARSIVNRLWHRLFGRGLVMPLDQMHSANPPSHPDLLEWLARDLAGNGYNLRRLMKGLILSKTWSQSSQWTGESEPSARYFAVANVRALTPMQLATSLQVAITDPARYEKMKPEEVEKHIVQLESRARGLAGQLEAPRERFQISVSEALLFSNNESVQRDLLSEGGDRLLRRLKEIKDDKQRISLAVENVLCRQPKPEEARLMSHFLAARKDRRLDACRHLLWALLTGAEMRFNH